MFSPIWCVRLILAFQKMQDTDIYRSLGVLYFYFCFLYSVVLCVCDFPSKHPRTVCYIVHSFASRLACSRHWHIEHFLMDSLFQPWIMRCSLQNCTMVLFSLRVSAAGNESELRADCDGSQGPNVRGLVYHVLSTLVFRSVPFPTTLSWQNGSRLCP